MSQKKENKVFYQLVTEKKIQRKKKKKDIQDIPWKARVYCFKQNDLEYCLGRQDEQGGREVEVKG